MIFKRISNERSMRLLQSKVFQKKYIVFNTYLRVNIFIYHNAPNHIVQFQIE